MTKQYVTSKLALTVSLFIIAPTFTIAPLAYAEEQSNQSRTSTDAATEQQALERLVVTATRTARPWLQTPATISRVPTNEQLPGQRTDAGELLAGIPGLQTDTRFNFAQDTRVTLRGFGTRAAFGVRGVRLRLDGIPLSMPDGQAQTSSILLDEAAHTEVLSGPLAGVYGNAAGGVVDWRSEIPRYSSIEGGFSAGSADRERHRADLTLRTENQGLRLFYADFSTDGDRDHAQAEREQLAVRGFHQWDNGVELIVRLDDNDAPLLQDPGSLTPEMWREDPDQTFGGATTFNTRKHIRHRQQSVTLRQQAATYDWQVSAWHGLREVEQYLPFPGDAPTSSGAVIDLERNFHGVQAQYSWLPLTDDSWRLTLGADIERQKDDRLGFVNDFGYRGDLRRDETGRVENDDLWAISDLQFAERWSWVTGFRYSNINFSVDDRYIVPDVVPDDSGALSYSEQAWSTALNYQLTDGMSAFVGFGQGFETPTLTEMAYQNEGTGLNTELTPAAIDQYEAGLKWLQPGWQAQLTGFIIQTDDEIVTDQSIDGRTTYRNAAETRRHGLELSSQWQVLPELWLRGSATWLDARYKGTEFDDNRLPGTARTNLYVQGNWQPWGGEQLRLSLSGRYRSQVATNDANDEFAPAYTTWNLAATSRLQYGDTWFEPWVRINNLTDKRYVGSVVVNQGSGRSFEPAAGRIYMLGFTLRHEWR